MLGFGRESLGKEGGGEREEKSEEEKQEAEDSEGISHLKVPKSPRGGSHLLCGAPGSPRPPRHERKLERALGPSPPPVPM